MYIYIYIYIYILANAAVLVSLLGQTPKSYKSLCNTTCLTRFLQQWRIMQYSMMILDTNTNA